MPRSWYRIKNSASEARVEIYDEIGGWGVSAKDFIRDLRALSGTPITLHIHSPGGDVLDGNAIYNALLRHAGGVTVQIDGYAASMASVIAMAGDTVRIAENGFIMIHNPQGIAWGDQRDMRKMADLIDKMRDGLVNAYAKKTGLPGEEIEEMMDAETWLTAQEAVDKGFADAVTDEVKLAAHADSRALGAFQRLPTALQHKPKDTMPRTRANAKGRRARAEDDPKKDDPENEDDTDKKDDPENTDEEENGEPTAEEQIEELEQRVEELEEQLEEEKAKAKAKAAAAAKASKSRDALVAKLDKANDRIAAQSIQIGELQDQIEDLDIRASKRAAGIVAGASHRPLNTAPKADKIDLSNLKGLERAKAAARNRLNS